MEEKARPHSQQILMNGSGIGMDADWLSQIDVILFFLIFGVTLGTIWCISIVLSPCV